MKRIETIVDFSNSSIENIEECNLIDNLRTILIDVLNVESINTNLIDVIKQQFKGDIENTIKTANEVCNNEFLYRSKWDMEKTNIPFHFEKEIDWTFTPNNDPEWCWMLNRHQYWISLGRAYILTKNQKYLDAFENQLKHWIESNTDVDNLRGKAWRSLEVGVRCDYWINALRYFIKDISDSSLELFIESLNQHAEFLFGHFSDYSLTSNWGIIENSGLYKVSNILGFLKNSNVWRKTAKKRLSEMINAQIYPDGVHWEQSSTYHNEVLNCFVASYNSDLLTNQKTFKELKNIIVRMAHTIQILSKPNNNQPLKGDSDEITIDDIMAEISYLFSDKTLKSKADKAFGYSNLWKYGLNGYEAYISLKSIERKETSYAFPYSNNYVLKSSNNLDATYLLFSAGNIGAGHGHADQLHFDLFAHNRDFLVDSGRFTYVEGSKWRKYFKLASAHNTMMIDDIHFTEYESSWSYKKIAKPFNHHFVTTDDYDFVKASHDGYLDLKDPVLHTRNILFVKPYFYVIFDQIDCQKKHNVSRFFNFKYPQVTVENNIIRTTHLDNNNLEIKLLPDASSIHISNEYNSPEYNLMNKSKRVTVNDKVDNNTTLTSLYSFTKSGKTDISQVDVFDRAGQKLSDDVVLSYSIKIKNIEYIIIFTKKAQPSGMDAYKVKERIVLGKLVVLKIQDGEETVTTLL